MWKSGSINCAFCFKHKSEDCLWRIVSALFFGQIKRLIFLDKNICVLCISYLILAMSDAVKAVSCVKVHCITGGVKNKLNCSNLFLPIQALPSDFCSHR